jgi:iron complex outermembrane receptor protein
MSSRKEILKLGGSALVLLAATGWAMAANAQTAPAATTAAGAAAATKAADAAQPASGGDSATVSEVVVTGTLIKGIAPVGTQVQTVTQQDIQRTGVASSNNLLATIPLMSTFNTVAASPVNLGNTALRPNIRGISTDQYAPSTTLLLMDGHNMVGTSVLQTTPDPSMIPPGAIERVEVVPDGGSSLYGSDAVSGIVNFITRKRFDGTEVVAHKGFADHYDSADFSLTTGKDWDGGSAVLSYFTRWNSALLAKYRDFPRQDLTPWGGTDTRVRSCNPATVNVGKVPYALPPGTPVFNGLTANTYNLCDVQQAGAAITPKEHQNSVFLAVQQDFTPSIHMEATAYYSDRLTKAYQPQLTTSGALINTTNPFFHTINGGTETSQTVAFSYAAVAGPSYQSSTEAKTWGISPEVTFKLGGDWDLKTLFNYGWSDTVMHIPELNAAYQASVLTQAPGSGVTLTPTTALNPYDVTQTNPAIIQNILNYENYAYGEQSLAQFRAVTNGTLYTLPGGNVRLAAGGQVGREYYNAMNANAPRGVTFGQPTKTESRMVYAVFGELFIPIVGADNEKPWIKSLSLDLSGRYDKYQDCCSTTNPKVGVTYEPFDGLRIRGNWGTSFNAPSMADTGDAIDGRVIVNMITPATTLAPDADPAVDALRPSLAVPGGNADLQPQEATTWSIGADYQPEQAPGLDVSLTYWRVELRKMIGTSTMPPNVLYATPAYSQYYILHPTLQQLEDLYGDLPVVGAQSLASLYGHGNDPYVVRDLRRHNLGNQNVYGLDWHLAYQHDVGAGRAWGQMDATYILGRDAEAYDGAPWIDIASKNARRLMLQANAGIEINNITAAATLNWNGGYDVVGVVGQTHVKSFHPLNLYFAYDLQGAGPLANTELTLNIDNVFDINAPFFNGSDISGVPGTANGSTLGRYFNFGIRKKF